MLLPFRPRKRALLRSIIRDMDHVGAVEFEKKENPPEFAYYERQRQCVCITFMCASKESLVVMASIVGKEHLSYS
jgi:hypothetical protein